MSVTVHSTRKNVKFPATAGRADRSPIASFSLAIVRFVREAILNAARLIGHALQAIAEARAQRAMIEAELYLNRYKHSSKNDDDLPVVS
jgi:hypothetical protein